MTIFFKVLKFKPVLTLYKTFLICYLCRKAVMDPVDEFNVLAAAICDEPADPDQHGPGASLDESLLDMEDDEIQVLEPPLIPTQADPLPAAHSTAANEKVNDNTMSIDSVQSERSNYASSNETRETHFTSYVKYGIKEKEKLKTELKQSVSNELDEETGRPLLGTAYQQCKSARAAAMFNHTVTNANISPESGSSTNTNIYPVGSFNCTGDTEVLRTFRGTRMSSNNITVNQNISLSYDPATLLCIICEKPHSILATGEGGAPPILIFSDQNFLPTLSKGSSCVAISRWRTGPWTSWWSWRRRSWGGTRSL